MPAKKTAPVKTSAPEKQPIGEKQSIGMTNPLGPKATIGIMVAVFAGGILLAARQPSVPVSTQPMTMSADVTPAAVKKIASSPSEAATTVPATDAVSAAAVPKASPVTLTGCLVQSADTFRLKDTAGAAAPKARSWKSGFLKKGSASVDIVDASHAMTLANHVGHRVSVTGTLVDREMQVRSLRRVSASCDQRQGL
jgi:hypothetical protein